MTPVKLMLKVKFKHCLRFTLGRILTFTKAARSWAVGYCCPSKQFVVTCKCLGFTLDKELSFKTYIANLVQKLRVMLGFYPFSLKVRIKLVSAIFLLLLDYGDVLYMNVSAKCLLSLNSVYHCALRFITGCRHLTHHCELYTKVNWPPLSVQSYFH